MISQSVNCYFCPQIVLQPFHVCLRFLVIIFIWDFFKKNVGRETAHEIRLLAVLPISGQQMVDCVKIALLVKFTNYVNIITLWKFVCFPFVSNENIMKIENSGTSCPRCLQCSSPVNLQFWNTHIIVFVLAYRHELAIKVWAIWNKIWILTDGSLR